MDHQECTRLWALLESVPDPRKRRGRRYGWPLLLMVICLGLAAGQRSVYAIAHWAKLRQDEILRALPWTAKRLPSVSTLYRALRHADQEALERLVGRYGQHVALWIRKHAGTKAKASDWQAVAADGKEVRGAGRHGRKVHLVSLVTHAKGLTLGQIRVDEKHYEPYALSDLLKGQDLRGMVMTLDALYTHKPLAQQIVDQGGHYFMMVKGNQPELRDHIAHLFAEAPLPGEQRWTYATADKGHGRIEERLTSSSEELNAFLDWPQVGQVLQRTCIQTRPGQPRSLKNTSWAITSLTHAQASPEDLAAIWRGHWTIENQVHYVRDETFGEDRCQIAQGGAAQNLAALRNAILIAFRARDWTSIAEAIRFYAASIQANIHLLTDPL